MADLWLILDVETTGLDPAAAGVWQLGAVLWYQGAELDAFEVFVQPLETRWTPEHREKARQVSGLTREEEALVLQSPPLLPALGYLWELLWWWDQPRVIATSYNLPFERAFLERGPTAISHLASEAGIDFRWGPCLMAAAATALVGLPGRLSLRKACEELGLTWSGSHRALADARLAAQVGERLGVFTREGER